MRRVATGLAGWMVMPVCVGLAPAADESLREPVHPRRNVDDFAPIEARWVRFRIEATNRSEPGIDELEIYGPADRSLNLALAANGARVSACGSIDGYRIHDVKGIHDGIYGNGHCWIADRVAGAWVTVELPEPALIDRVVWGRDREGSFVDRLATEYFIEAALESGDWRVVASSEDRRPLGLGSELSPLNPWTEQLRMRYSSTAMAGQGEAVPAPGHVVDVWQSEDGLPGNVITALVQTPDGYLWIGTPSGLARFDGIRFATFGEREGLPDPRVRCLAVDAAGDLWIGTEGGLVRMRGRAFEVFSARDGLPSSSIDAIVAEAGGGLRVSAGGAVLRWRDGRVVGEPFRLQAAPLRMTADDEGGVWLLGNHLLRWGEGAPEPVEREDEPSNFSSLGAFHAGPSGRLWYGGANGYLGVLDDGDLTVYTESDGLPPGPIWEILETSDGDVWVGTAGAGLGRLSGGRFTSITTLEGLASNSIRCLLEDIEGNIWVGTNGGGLHRLKRRVILTLTSSNGLTHEVVTSIAEGRDGTIYVGTNGGGLSVHEDATCRAHHLSYLLDNAAVRSLLVDGDGGLWIGTFGNGLFRWANDRLTGFVDDPAVGIDVSALVEDSDGALWVGSLGIGLGVIRPTEVDSPSGASGRSQADTEVASPHLRKAGALVVGEAALGGAVTCLAAAPNGALWIGTSGGGLWRRHPDADGMRRFTDADGLPSDFIRTLRFASDGTLWIGTLGGLCRHVEGDAFDRLGGTGAPWDEVVSQLVESSDGLLWVGTNRGLVRIDGLGDAADDGEGGGERQAGRPRAIAFGKTDGLESLEFTGGYSPAGLRTRDGRLLFGSVRGLVVVRESDAATLASSASVLVEEVLADGQPVVDGEIPSGTKRVEFAFTAPVLSAPERVRFRYRLAGVEELWNEAGGGRVASYAGIPPGRFRFEVEATDSLGAWTGQVAEVVVRLPPAWWEAAWFRILLLLPLLGAVALGVRFLAARRYRRRLEVLERERTLATERARIARDIHDDLGAHLTEISLLSERGRRHPAEAGPFLERIAVTARDLVRDVDAIVWAVNPRHDSIDSLAAYLAHSASEYLASAGLRCRLDIPTELPNLRMTSEVRHHILLAVKEALHNAVRHSAADTVWLSLHCEHGNLTVEVRDNGSGFDPEAATATGADGLSNMRERIGMAGGSCVIASAPGSGTRVVFSVPSQVDEAKRPPEAPPATVDRTIRPRTA